MEVNLSENDLFATIGRLYMEAQARAQREARLVRQLQDAQAEKPADEQEEGAA